MDAIAYNTSIAVSKCEWQMMPGHLSNNFQTERQSNYSAFSGSRVEGNALHLTKTQKVENSQTQEGSSKAKELQKLLNVYPRDKSGAFFRFLTLKDL